MTTSSRFPPNVIAAACASMRKWDIPASVCLAQWALESAYGAHAPGDNPFGIKARSGEPSQSLMTWEVIGGKNVRLAQQFRLFSSLAEAFDAHGSLLAKGPAYAAARAVRHDAKLFAKALTGHYATDPAYGSKLISIMDQNGLYEWDRTTPTPAKAAPVIIPPVAGPPLLAPPKSLWARFLAWAGFATA